MSSIERARAFVNRGRQPADPRLCPHYGYRSTKRPGSYRRTIRDLGACARSAPLPESIQRWPAPNATPAACSRVPCGRRAIYASTSAVRCAASPRGCTRRSSRRGPLARLGPRVADALPSHSQARLHHTTLWRWQAWQVLICDGAAAYQELLAWDAPQVQLQRCITHLWCNVRGRLHVLASRLGDETAAARVALHLVWDAADRQDAWDARRLGWSGPRSR